jgi:hypothetical protein
MGKLKENQAGTAFATAIVLFMFGGQRGALSTAATHTLLLINWLS